MEYKKKRLRFSTLEDLFLLQQVVCLNAYNDANKWGNIQSLNIE
jgi:hypothetical protein